MAKSKLRVVVRDKASPPPRQYDVFLELDGQTRAESLNVDDQTGTGSVEFELDAAAAGRLTIEKPNVLADAASLSSPTTVLLEESHPYNGSVQGTGSKLRFVPNGFSNTKTQQINEATVSYQTGPDVTVTVFTLTVDPIPEFFVRENPGNKLADKVPKDAKLPESFRPVAFFFPGTNPERRALVFSGVHGSEPEGVRMVELILDELGSGRWVPEFNTLIVPRIIPRTQPLGEPLRGDPARRWVQRDRLDRTVPGRDDAGCEPNRTFPLPGTAYATAREIGRGPKGAELIYAKTNKTPAGTNAAQRMLPETRLLQALIERFRPERIATLHSHSAKPARGDSSGIFVDPRGGVDQKSDQAKTPEGDSDDELTRDMLCAFQHIRTDVNLFTIREPLLGNLIIPTRKKKNTGKKANQKAVLFPLVDDLRDATVHYDPNAPHAQGNSLGDWAPTAIAEKIPGVALPRGNRPGITTVTVEFPHGESDATIQTLLRIHAEVTLSVFLGATQKNSPATHLAARVTKQDPAAQSEPFIPKGCEERP